jgi:hypothetical protein
MEQVQTVKGQTLFRNLYIGWYYSHDFGLTITDIRCGVCKSPVQPIAIQAADMIYMTCSDGHLVGTWDDPCEAERKYRMAQTHGAVMRFIDRQSYNNNMFDVVQDFKSNFDIGNALP